MTVKEILTHFESLGNEKMRKQNMNHGSGDNQFGVRLGEIRKIGKKIKTNHALALELWDTGNLEARRLAILTMNPNSLSATEVDNLVRSENFVEVIDWLSAYVIKNHPDKEKLRQEWMTSDHPMAARAGWSLTAGKVAREPDEMDFSKILDRIESEMGGALSEVQWTMNNTLAAIGINNPKHRKRALAIGEKLGIYQDYPVSKGCTSPFAPIWINEMVKRQG